MKWWIVGLVAGVLGCGGPVVTGNVRVGDHVERLSLTDTQRDVLARAEVDLRCPSSDIVVETVEATAGLRAEGCGVEAVYDCETRRNGIHPPCPVRYVRSLSAGTPAPSLEALVDPPPPEEREEPRRRDSVDDAPRRLSEDAQMSAEAAEAREREGRLDGIEEGTERTAVDGDLYRGRLHAFFRRGWSVPTTLTPDELSDLMCVVMIDVAADTRIIGFRISRGSGDPGFDASVEAQLTRIRASEPNIPAPPEEVAADYLGREIAVRFRGADVRR